MDPYAALDRMFDKSLEPYERAWAANDLRDWLDRGGFPPAPFGGDAEVPLREAIAAVMALVCSKCEGEGVIRFEVAGPDRFGNYDCDEATCPVCDGSGKPTPT